MPTSSTRRLSGEVELFRIRVAAAESKLKLFREKWRQAKRHRKEAKRIARSARKQFKQAKSDLAQFCEALAEAERKFFNAGERALERKMAKQKAVASVEKRASKKPTASRKPRAPKAVGTQSNKASAEPVTGQAVRKLPLTEETQPTTPVNPNAEVAEIVSLPTQTTDHTSYEQTLG